MAEREPGFYNWLIHAMVEALDAEAEEQKRQIEFWSSREPIAAPEIDERQEKSDRELADLCLDTLRDIGAARTTLASIDGQMPRHHLDEAYAAILRGLEREVREYRLRLAAIVTCQGISEELEAHFRLSLLAASELEQAVARARGSAESLAKLGRLRDETE